MSDKKKPLPRPPASPFGRTSPEERGERPLLADEIARAASEGRLEEFMEKEMPYNEYARKLVSMIIGMTGITYPQGLQIGEVKGEKTHNPSGDAGSSERMTARVQPPEDIVRAAGKGDVEQLKGLLEREQKRRSGFSEEPSAAEAAADVQPAALERETLDRLIKIASENDLKLDWIILRALRLYIQEYQRTGRL